MLGPHVIDHADADASSQPKPFPVCYVGVDVDNVAPQDTIAATLAIINPKPLIIQIEFRAQPSSWIPPPGSSLRRMV